MAYNDIEQKAIWERFFDGIPVDRYSVFLHSSNAIAESWMQTCNIIPTIPTEWGSFSLVEVQQALFETAALDEATTKFILLSGDSIPLYTFEQIFAKLGSDTKGYMLRNPVNTATHAVREKTTNRAEWPATRKWVWKTGSQWVILNRDHVKLLQDNWPMLKTVFGKSDIPDEHMYLVFFNGFDAMDSFHIACPIYINWSIMRAPCSVWHRMSPYTYHNYDFTQTRIDIIYKTRSLFLRKICGVAGAAPLIDWGSERLLQVTNTKNPHVLPKRIIRKL
jgi:hypothetical protein